MVEQNAPQAQAGASGIQQQPYGLAGGQSASQPIGGYPSFQQPPTQESAMQRPPAQQNLAQQPQQNPQPAQQIPAQQNLAQQPQQNPQLAQQIPAQQPPAQQLQNPQQQTPAQQPPAQQLQNPQQQAPAQQPPGQQQTPAQQPPAQQQAPAQQPPAQQGVGQQPPAQQNPQVAGQQAGSRGAQQTTQPPQSGATRSWSQSTPSSPGSAQPTGQGAPAQSGAMSSGQPPQSQQPQGTGQPASGTPAGTGPYGSQSAMIQSPTMGTTQGPSIRSPVSEFSASDTTGTPIRTTSSAGPQRQATQAQQAPAGGRGYEQTVAQEVQAAVDGVDQLANVAEWATTRFAQQGNADASRACEDVHDRAHTATDFMLRGSPFAASAARELQATIDGAVQELQQHQTPEAQDVLTRAQQATQLLEAAVSRLDPASGTTQ